MCAFCTLFALFDHYFVNHFHGKTLATTFHKRKNRTYSNEEIECAASSGVVNWASFANWWTKEQRTCTCGVIRERQAHNVSNVPSLLPFNSFLAKTGTIRELLCYDPFDYLTFIRKFKTSSNQSQQRTRRASRKVAAMSSLGRSLACFQSKGGGRGPPPTLAPPPPRTLNKRASDHRGNPAECNLQKFVDAPFSL